MSIKFKLLFPIFLQIILCFQELRAQDDFHHFYTDKSSDTFLSIEALSSRIEGPEIQMHLLNAAIFHFTNMERKKEKLDVFVFNENLYKSSALHSERMIVDDFFSHENKRQRKWRTPKDRIFFYDDSYKTVGENILENFLLDYSGKTLRYRTEFDTNGSTIYLNPEGEVMENSTYMDLADRLVTQWMNSPPHRANILEKRFDLLACACEVNLDKTPILIRCTQNFGSFQSATR